LIVLVEVARAEEEDVGPLEVGSSGKASLLEKVVLVLLVIEAAVSSGGGSKLGGEVASSGGGKEVPLHTCEREQTA
jgi:hypothetical protein